MRPIFKYGIVRLCIGLSTLSLVQSCGPVHDGKIPVQSDGQLVSDRPVLKGNYIQMNESKAQKNREHKRTASVVGRSTAIDQVSSNHDACSGAVCDSPKFLFKKDLKLLDLKDKDTYIHTIQRGTIKTLGKAKRLPEKEEVQLDIAHNQGSQGGGQKETSLYTAEEIDIWNPADFDDACSESKRGSSLKKWLCVIGIVATVGLVIGATIWKFILPTNIDIANVTTISPFRTSDSSSVSVLGPMPTDTDQLDTTAYDLYQRITKYASPPPKQRSTRKPNSPTTPKQRSTRKPNSPTQLPTGCSSYAMDILGNNYLHRYIAKNSTVYNKIVENNLKGYEKENARQLMREENKNGCTPLDAAIQCGNVIASFLKNLGALVGKHCRMK